MQWNHIKSNFFLNPIEKNLGVFFFEKNLGVFFNLSFNIKLI